MSKRAMSDHTSLPWSIDDDGDTVFIWADAVKDYVAVVKEFGWSAPMHANAAFIVKAVNSHDRLVQAVTSAKRLIGATNDTALPAVKESNINTAWHILDDALASIKVPA